MLGMAAGESAGTEPRLVSPRQLDRAADRVADLTEKIDALHLARDKFRQLTYSADLPSAMPRRFSTRWDQVKAAWENLTRNPAASKRIGRDGQVRELVIESGQLLEKLRTQLHGAEFSRAGRADRGGPFAGGGKAAEKAGPRRSADRRPGRRAGPSGRRIGAGPVRRWHSLAAGAGARSGRAGRKPLAPGRRLAVAGVSGHDLGSEDVLRNYPPTELRAVREAFGRLRAAYSIPPTDGRQKSPPR